MDIFIFRRDFRLEDNLGLIEATKNSNILPIFIFTPEQIENNDYRSDNAIQFMVESLEDLDNKLKKYKSKLHIFLGDNLSILNKINNEVKIRTVYFNKDFTKYAKNRDKSISGKFNIKTIEDYLLHPMDTLKKKDGTIYKVFTPFYRYSGNFKVDKPTKYQYKNNMFLNRNFEFEIKFDDIKDKFSQNSDIFQNGGRKLALKRLKKINLENYNDDRNNLTKESSHLSPYIKFGCVSIREVYHSFLEKYKKDNAIFAQLYWREFYFYIIHYNPNILNKPFKEKYNNISWRNNICDFEAWKYGETGFPIVDAAMRHMNKTGYMPNRGRLIVSNFLIKILMIDWKWGEKYFAQKLIDYDPAVNNGNWQWVSGTGVDYQPTFRILNPWTQITKYDNKCEYIKKWVPELNEIPIKDIKVWDQKCNNYNIYVKPIVNYKESRKLALKMYDV